MNGGGILTSKVAALHQERNRNGSGLHLLVRLRRVCVCVRVKNRTNLLALCSGQ